MSRYIDANILKEKILKERDKIPFKKIDPYSFGVETHYRDGAAMRGGIRKALRCLEQTPTADVVEVVRCKDCKYLKYGYQCYRPLGINLSNNGDAYVLVDPENDFCSGAERREDTE